MGDELHLPILLGWVLVFVYEYSRVEWDGGATAFVDLVADDAGNMPSRQSACFQILFSLHWLILNLTHHGYNLSKGINTT